MAMLFMPRTLALVAFAVDRYFDRYLRSDSSGTICATVPVSVAVPKAARS
jgi:hypothetical protein